MEHADEEIRTSAYAIITELVSLHYDKLAPFMQRIFKNTMTVIQKGEDEEDLCKLAIEFWCTICDEELNIQEENDLNHDTPNFKAKKNEMFVKGALQFLVQFITQCLTLQDEDVDPDEWTISMHAGVCLQLIAQTVQDDIVQYILPFFETNLLSADWKLR